MRQVKHLVMAGTRFTAALAMVLALSGFTAATHEPGRVKIVTTDVSHFWRAFDDLARALGLCLLGAEGV